MGSIYRHPVSEFGPVVGDAVFRKIEIDVTDIAGGLERVPSRVKEMNTGRCIYHSSSCHEKNLDSNTTRIAQNKISNKLRE